MDYTVNYQINVNSDPALESIRKFQEATQQMEALTKRFDVVAKSIGKVNSAFASLNKNHVKMDINTSAVEQKLERVIALLERAKTALNAISQGKIQKVMSAPMAGVYGNGKKASTTFTGEKVNTKAAQTDLTNLMKKISETQSRIDNINKRYINPKARTKTAMESLDKLIAKIEQIKAMSNITISASGPRQSGQKASTATAGASAAAAGAATAASGAATGGKKASTTVRRTSAGTPVNRTLFPSVRQVLGPTYATTGTNVAGEMVKGIGIAYGLSSLMSGVTSVFKEATAYDNITQTTKNILGTHDKSPNFDTKFDKANEVMRQVGVETKFTAPQVASAGKFLAMAGMTVDDIQQSIKPIANLALVGDTDLGSTADMTTNIMTSYEIPAKRMSNAADVLTMTFTKTNTTLWDLAESFKYAGTVAHQSGMSFENASAVLGVLGDAGIQGSHAGTTLRMMLLNMMNPTKKGKAAWKALGIKTKDENGNMRDFNTILSELNEKRKSVSAGDFQSLINNMFRVTAAPGALALIQNADKVKQVTELNRDKSIGLSENLADEKKNTIQGLWYQMTSAFTESGMQGFEQMQDAIRDFLKRMIELMKSPEFAQGLKDMMDLFLKTIDSMVSMFKAIMSVWNALPNWSKDFIATWIKWHMWLSLGASAVKSIWSGFMMIRSLLQGQLLYGIASFTSNIISGVKAFREMYVLSRMYGMGRLASWKNAAMQIGLINGAGAAAQVAGTVGVGAAGTGVLSKVAGASIWSTIGSVGKWLLFTQAGLVTTGIAALAALTVYTISARNATIDAYNANVEWANSFRTLGSLSMRLNNESDVFAANMIAASSRIATENEMVRAAADNWKRYWAEKNGSKAGSDKGKNFFETTNGEIYKEAFGKIGGLGNAWGQLWGKSLTEQYAPVIESLAGLKVGGGYNSLITRKFGTRIHGTNGEYIDYLNLFGHQLELGAGGVINDDTARQLQLMKIGADPNNERIQSYLKWMQQQIAVAPNQAERYKVINQGWQQFYIPQNQIDNTLHYGAAGSAFENPTEHQIYFSQSAADATNYMIGSLKDAFLAYTQILDAFDKGKQIDPMKVQDVFARITGTMNLIGSPTGIFGTPEWMKRVRQNNSEMTISDFLGTVNSAFSNMATFIGEMPERYRPLFARFLDRNYWEGFFPSGSSFSLSPGGFGGGDKIGDKKVFDGKQYTYEIRAPFTVPQWYDAKGNTYTPKKTTETVTPTPTKRWTPNTNKTLNRIHTGADESKYKNHYNSNAAAPKQVIVRIGNLMNVDKIDLTNEHKAAAVANLKQDLASALLDVVQDFNENVIG